MALASIESYAPAAFKDLGLTSHLALLEHAWKQEVGTWGARARLVALERGALIVDVDAAPLMQELVFRRKELIRRLNLRLGEPLITALRVRVSGHGQ